MLRRGLAVCWTAAMGCLALAAPASAQIGSDRYASIVMEGRTGNVLSAVNPDEPRYPASLTKMMTLYMLFEAMREGQVSMATPIVMSAEAASRMPSKLGIPPGRSIAAEVAIYALVLKSANDVAVAVGEHLGGSEERFAQMMTMRARQLGMTRTTFRNASGLPDLDQQTTARDMATLGRRLFLDFPEHWHFFGNSHAQAGGFRFRSHNRMIGEYEGVDGIKTGYIGASGFNNVVSAQRQGQRVFVSVFGGMSWVERDQHAAMLLDDGFSRLGVAPSAPRLQEVPAVAALRGPILAGRAQAAMPPRMARGRDIDPRMARGRDFDPREREYVVREVVLRPSARPAQGRRSVPARGRMIEQGDGGRVLRPTPGLRRTLAPVPPPAARPPQRARRG
ncbi:D-alanyl-D-alanine carboxypeptidase family protein [Muricoccus radiodurans]|uniref:D-alanyl-D-alanine carboxypeptidase family protein n=1 Tax=Muricoccus radiodurans TaxID=2231721 RepID=UPI003CF0210A